MSEAIYLSDPDGNGIEIYVDRPREEGPFGGGALQMGSAPLDVDGVLQELGSSGNGFPELPNGTTVGHIHLHVSQFEEAVSFYQDVIGFDLIQFYGDSAAFLSAGGYHHHITLNTWLGVGAALPPAGAVGLKRFEIILPDRKVLEEVLTRISRTGLEAEPSENGVTPDDPFGNSIMLRVGL